MKLPLLSLLAASALILPALALSAADFSETWLAESAGADGGQLEVWLLANGDASKIAIVEAAGVKSLRIGPETFAHLRTKPAFPAGNNLSLSARLRLDPKVAKTGVGFGVRTEKLGQPEGYEVRINPALAKIFVFRVFGDGEKQLLEKPFAADDAPHDVTLQIDRSGSPAKLALSVDGDELGTALDVSPIDLGANVRPYITSRGGTLVSYEKIELKAP